MDRDPPTYNFYMYVVYLWAEDAQSNGCMNKGPFVYVDFIYGVVPNQVHPSSYFKFTWRDHITRRQETHLETAKVYSFHLLLSIIALLPLMCPRYCLLSPCLMKKEDDGHIHMQAD